MSNELRQRGRRKPQKTYAQIVEQIRREISSGDLRPGDRLPSEPNLSRKLGVSRPTMREALKVLESQGVLESSTGPTGGTFVRLMDSSDAAEYLTDFIGLLLDVDRLWLEELYAAREAIEIPATGLAAIRRTEKDLAAIKAIIENDSLKDSDNLVSDISFHRAVAEASKNRMFSLFMNSIHKTIRTLAERYILPEAKQTSQRQHRLIYEAIAGRDADMASRRMQEHLYLAREVYRQAIPKNTSKHTTLKNPAPDID